MNGCISMERILSKLDEHLHKNDTAAAERHLLYWLSETTANHDTRTELLIRNELMGLYRKLGKQEPAMACVHAALKTIEEEQIGHQVGAATTFLNCATVYKAFGMAEEALPLFRRAKAVYESELDKKDRRLGGLYNNMALALVDVGSFAEAKELYEQAISVMREQENGAPEVAITYLNMANAVEAELGALDAEEQIGAYLDQAERLLEEAAVRDGYYAFVCEKCASVFGYYGRFLYEKELTERARRIYEG
ncbi:MAG: tetratricopeptide repeat protein [Ruminococcaceae bacterium]|nr:tetratricopeptide repeat protein [Oscillospiraceae bacterium]